MKTEHEEKSTSPFPTAQEYYAAENKIHLMGNTDIGEQPASTWKSFHFGLQPEGLKNIDAPAGEKKRKVLVISAGDVWLKFAKASLDHRGTEYFVFDPNLLKNDEKEKPEAKTAEEKQERAGIDAQHIVPADASGRKPDLKSIPKDVDSVIILAPPHLHKDYILWAQQQGLPAMVEKPLVDSVADFKELDAAMASPKAPVYCMDWEAAHVTPLAAIIGNATGTRVPFADAVKYKSKEEEQRFREEFDFQNIKRIEAPFVEADKSTEPGGFGSVKYVEDNRPDIYKSGALKDMGVHPMAALTRLGFMPEKVTSVVLGDSREQTEKGVFRKIGNGEDSPAWYARAELISDFNGQKIPTIIESAKGALHDDMHITLIDQHGNSLRWEFGNEKSEVVLRNAAGDIRATANCEIDPYAIMYEEAKRLFDTQKNSPQKTALYYAEQRAILHAIAEMEELGRKGTVAPSDKVSQLALEKPPTTVDLAIADVNPPEKFTMRA